MKIKARIIFRLLLIFIILSLFYLDCGKVAERPEKKPTLAKVNQDIITPDEFRYNYEFGLPRLKIGEDAKLNYLKAMIYEKLISQQGYKKGLNKSDYVQKNIKLLKKDLLVEYFVKEEIDPKINITEREIKEYITESSVSFQYKFWLEDNLSRAEKIKKDMEEKGFESVVEGQLQNQPELNLDDSFYESDYVTAHGIRPEIFKAIKDLPIGEISDPVFFNGQYWIFQMEDIRREGLFEFDFKRKSTTVEQILFYQKRSKVITNYVDSLLTPKNIVTKGDALGILAAAYWEWMNSEKYSQKDFRKFANTKNSELEKIENLNSNRNQTIIRHKDGTINLDQLVQYLPFERLKTDYTDKQEFLGDLNLLVRNYIRDYFIAGQAKELGIDKNQEYQEEIDRWKNKWVFEEFISRLNNDISIKEEALQEYFSANIDQYQSDAGDSVSFNKIKEKVKNDYINEKRKEKILATVNKLKNEGDVQINKAALDTIDVIRSKTSPWLSLPAYKKGPNTMAWPVVNAMWSPEIIKEAKDD